MKLLLAKNPLHWEHERARRALAYERIDYKLLLRGMIRKYFWNCFAVPPVIFRNLHPDHPAHLETTHNRTTHEFWGYRIVLDSFELASWLLEEGIPLTAVLAHELCHLYRQEVEGLVGNHTSGFDNLCETVRFRHDCPVVDGKGFYLKPIR